MDADEFKRRFLPCHAKLYRTACMLTGNAQDAEDMVQEAYMRLWDKRNELTHVESAEAYGVTLVKHLCLDWLRKNSRQAATCMPEDVALAAEDNDSPGIRTEAHDEADCLRRLISRLPANQRQVMWLRDVNECSYDEIAQATGLSDVNIRVLLSRARKMIREQYKRICDYGQS